MRSSATRASKRSETGLVADSRQLLPIRFKSLRGRRDAVLALPMLRAACHWTDLSVYLFIYRVQVYPGQMFSVLYIFYFSSLIPLRMAISLQCEPAEQSEGGKALKDHISKSKRYKIRTSVWCSATANTHVRATITSKLVNFASLITESKRQDLKI